MSQISDSSQIFKETSDEQIPHDDLNLLKLEISKLKKLINSLETEQLMFRGLLNTIPDNVYFKDRKSRFTCLSKAIIQWFKNKNDIDEVLGKTDFDMFTSEHAQEAYDDEQHIMDSGEPLINKEEKETWDDGSITWVSSSKVPLFDKQNNIIGIVGISRDITDRKETETKLRQYQENLEYAKQETDNILANVDEGLFLLDANKKLSSQYSAELESILIENSLASRHLLDILKGKISANEIDSVNRYLELLFDDSNDEDMLQDLNPLIKLPMSIEGLEKYLTFKFKRVTNKKGKTSQLISTVTDVTKEVLLTKSLEESKAENKRKIDRMLCLLNIDPTMLKEFIHSVQEELQTAEESVEKLYKTPTNRSLIETIYRSVHTIKGNASLLEIDFFAEKAHEAENILSTFKDTNLKRKNILVIKLEISALSKMYEELRDMIGQFSKIHEQFRPRRNHEYNMLINSLTKLAERLIENNDKLVELDFSEFEASNIPFQHKLTIRDILVQLIRNSITHGIEQTNDREKAGKPPEGNIHISAFTQDSIFELKFIDDGRGLDYDGLRKKAIESKKWSAAEINKWDDERVSRLIFKSGISTAKKTDLVAGRGVGMDIILKKIEKAGGAIDIDTEKGRYTSFTIKIPVSKEKS